MNEHMIEMDHGEFITFHNDNKLIIIKNIEEIEHEEDKKMIMDFIKCQPEELHIEVTRSLGDDVIIYTNKIYKSRDKILMNDGDE